MDNDTKDLVSYYGTFTEVTAPKTYLSLLDEYEKVSLTQEEYKTGFKQLFEAFTNPNNLYQKCGKVKRTTRGNAGDI